MLRAAGNQFVPQQWVASPQATNQYPACEQPLTQFELDRFRGVSLGRCKACGGIWLGHGEASEIARRLEAGDSAPASPPAPIPIASVPGGSGLELADIPRPAPSPPFELPGAPAAEQRFEPGRGFARQELASLFERLFLGRYRRSERGGPGGSARARAFRLSSSSKSSASPASARRRSALSACLENSRLRSASVRAERQGSSSSIRTCGAPSCAAERMTSASTTAR